MKTRGTRATTTQSRMGDEYDFSREEKSEAEEENEEETPKGAVTTSNAAMDESSSEEDDPRLSVKISFKGDEALRASMPPVVSRISSKAEYRRMVKENLRGSPRVWTV